MTSLWRHLSFLQIMSLFQILWNLQTSYLVPMYNYIRHIYWLEWKWPWHSWRLQAKVKGHKIWINGHILEAISPIDFILGTKVQPNKHIQWPKCRWPWPKVKVKDQGHIFPKWVKNQRTDHISEAISPTDFIFGANVQPIKAHSMTQVMMTLTKCQGRRSR